VRDARGAPLEAYVSVAADPEVPYLTRISVAGCGRDALESGKIREEVCDALRTADWVVRDRFTAGAVGKHLDLYIGEQDRRDFEAKSPRAIHVLGARVQLTAYAGAGGP
jgi:hypothetical protein